MRLEGLLCGEFHLAYSVLGAGGRAFESPGREPRSVSRSSAIRTLAHLCRHIARSGESNPVKCEAQVAAVIAFTVEPGPEYVACGEFEVEVRR